MEHLIDPRLFTGLSTYQDVVIGGRTVRKGSHDCLGRWEAIAPHMPRAGSVLDVGSNFGWFGLKICDTSECVVLSVEGDERCAVQRRLLELNHCERVCLAARKVDARLIAALARAGQRFDAVLCLSVLHWIRGHREVLSGLGSISARLFVEQPHPAETGAGVERIRRDIGPIGSYLKALFPTRPSHCLATLPSHRDPRFQRELWMVDEAPGMRAGPSPGLDASVLLTIPSGWPPRSWWRRQLSEIESAVGHTPSRPVNLLFGPAGLSVTESEPGSNTLTQWARKARAFPRHDCCRPTGCVCTGGALVRLDPPPSAAAVVAIVGRVVIGLVAARPALPSGVTTRPANLPGDAKSGRMRGVSLPGPNRFTQD